MPTVPEYKSTPSPENTCWMYLLRHGATENNLHHPPRLQGRCDTPLSVQGRWEAQQTSRLLADRNLSAVFSSSLPRALETARTVAQPHALPVQAVDALVEVDVGQWQDMDWNEIERADPEAYRLYLEDGSVHGFVGGENYRQVLDRVLPAFTQLMRENLGRRIAVVGHNVVNRVFLVHLLGLPLGEIRRISQDNCCVNLIRYGNGKFKPITINAVFHLET